MALLIRQPPSKESKNLSDYIKNQVGQEIKFNQDSNNSKQEEELQRQFLKFYRDRVFYLPSKTPEKFIWDNVSTLKNQEEMPECYKQAFKSYTQSDLGEDDVNSEQIFVIQQSMLAKIPNDCDEMKNLITTLEFIINNSIS